MIDFTRIENLEPWKLKYSNCTLTDSYINVNKSTGEAVNNEYSREYGLETSSNKIKGSIHKYFSNITGNSYFGNSNDFNYSQLVTTLDFLNDKFELNKHLNKLTTLEFGLNISSNKSANDIIKENVKFYQYKNPTEEKFATTRASKFFKLTDYTVKVYDKAKQYGIQDTSILRYEIHYKSKQFKKFGINHLNDLRCKDKLRRMFKDYLLKFDDLFIIDSFNRLSKIKKNEIKSLLYDIGENNFNNSTARMRTIRKLNKIVEAEGLNKTKSYLKGLLINKFDELLNVTNSNYSNY